jgi:hypothetical protein
MEITQHFYACLESRDWPCVASLVHDQAMLGRIETNARSFGAIKSVNYEGVFSLTDSTVFPQPWRVTFRTFGEDRPPGLRTGPDLFSLAFTYAWMTGRRFVPTDLTEYGWLG